MEWCKHFSSQWWKWKTKECWCVLVYRKGDKSRFFFSYLERTQNFQERETQRETRCYRNYGYDCNKNIKNYCWASLFFKINFAIFRKVKGSPVSKHALDFSKSTALLSHVLVVMLAFEWWFLNRSASVEAEMALVRASLLFLHNERLCEFPW